MNFFVRLDEFIGTLFNAAHFALEFCDVIKLKYAIGNGPRVIYNVRASYELFAFYYYNLFISRNRGSEYRYCRRCSYLHLRV